MGKSNGPLKWAKPGVRLEASRSIGVWRRRGGFALVCLFSVWLGFGSCFSAELSSIFSEEYRPANVNGKFELKVGPRETRDIEFVFRLAGGQFVAPARLLDTILVESPVVDGELNYGFSIVALLPSFDGRTDDNFGQFLAGSADANRVRMAVYRLCLRPPVPYQCSVETRALQVLDAEWGRLVPLAEEVVTAPPGLKWFAHLVEPALNPENANAVKVRSEVFDIAAATGATAQPRTEFIICDAAGTVRVPHCHHQFPWKQNYWVRVSYKKENITEWLEIKEGSIHILTEMQNSKPGNARATIYSPG